MQISKSSFSTTGVTAEFLEVKAKVNEAFSLLEANILSDNLAKYKDDLNFFTSAKVIGYKKADAGELFKNYNLCKQYLMKIIKQKVIYTQTLSPSNIKQAIITLMEIEDGVPKLKEAMEKFKTPITSTTVYKCKEVVEVFDLLVNRLTNYNKYEYCSAANIVNVLSTSKPENECQQSEIEKSEKLVEILEEYADQIPRVKSKLMKIYMNGAGDMFNASQVELTNVFKDDGTFEEGKGADCQK